MEKEATTPELQEAFRTHREETETHVERLEEVFSSINESPATKTCAAMQGLVEESEEMVEENRGSPAIDAALIAAAQKVEHYEIASYGTLCTWAETMGHTRAAELLEATLDEEKNTDARLTEIAEMVANPSAESA